MGLVRLLAALAVIIVVVGSSGSKVSSLHEQPDPPSIILFVADDLGFVQISPPASAHPSSRCTKWGLSSSKPHMHTHALAHTHTHALTHTHAHAPHALTRTHAPENDHA